MWLKEGDAEGRPAKLTSFDPDKRVFIVREGDAERAIEERLLQEVVFVRAKREPTARVVRLAVVSGERISGKILGIANETLRLQAVGIREPIECPLKSLQAIVGLKSNESEDAEGPAADTPECRLFADNVSLRAVDGSASGTRSAGIPAAA